MTRVELAEKIGVTKLTILNWEHGTHEIKGSNAKKLADHFGVSIPYLLGYDTDNTLQDLITKINEWAISHGLDKGNPKIEWMKVTEEVGEIRDVFLKPNNFADPEWSLKRRYRRLYRNASGFMLTTRLRRRGVSHNSL